MSGFPEFRARARAGGMVPVWREVIFDGATPVAAFARLHRGPYGFLLESLEGGERWARYSFLGTEPREVYRYRGRTVERWTAAAGVEPLPDASPFGHLAELMRSRPPVTVPGLPPFTGGAVGFLGYDTVRTLERLGDGPGDDRDLMDGVMMLADAVVIVDNLLQRATVVVSVETATGMDDAELRRRYHGAEERIADWLGRLGEGPALPPLALAPLPRPATVSPYPDDRFREDVERIRRYIAAGDIFQAVLSRRLDLPAPDPFRTYRFLRALNPAPYLYYLQCDDLHLVGSSPEVLVRVSGEQVTVRPIAGTRPRGATPEDDAALARELLADPKERAEHLMLVDLGRNDVGRICDYSSVAVEALMTIERYSHVMHLVSEVRGRLRPDQDALAALAACFPAGTVSGAPKVRAMEILDELEPVRRGPYAGAVGYVGWGGRSLDTAIAIRSCAIRGGTAWVQAGAGIVADSNPEAEWRETEAKAGAVLAALALATGSTGAGAGSW